MRTPPPTRDSSGHDASNWWKRRPPWQKIFVVFVILWVPIGLVTLVRDSSPTTTTTEVAAQDLTDYWWPLPEEMARYKATCSPIDYALLVESPDQHEGEPVKFRGQVLQIGDVPGGVSLLLAVTKSGSDYNPDDVVAVFQRGKAVGVREGSVVDVWGPCTGSRPYGSAAGRDTRIPQMAAASLTVVEDGQSSRISWGRPPGADIYHGLDLRTAAEDEGDQDYRQWVGGKFWIVVDVARILATGQRTEFLAYSGARGWYPGFTVKVINSERMDLSEDEPLLLWGTITGVHGSQLEWTPEGGPVFEVDYWRPAELAD